VLGWLDGYGHSWHGQLTHMPGPEPCHRITTLCRLHGKATAAANIITQNYSSITEIPVQYKFTT
jgi:hypothetical protein